MKTPKDILFAKHRPVEPKLDAIRQEVVATVSERRAPEAKPLAQAEPSGGVIHFLRELFLLKRRAWAGLAAVWILIFALRLSTQDGTQAVAKESSVSKEAIAELREQRLFFAELIGLRETRDAEPPKSFPPGPRSERRSETMSA